MKMIFKNLIISLIILAVTFTSVTSLYCYECNTLLSAGCDNPLKSSSYFYVKCHEDHPFCVVYYYKIFM